MALALTSFEAYGIAVDQPLSKKYVQRAVLKITGANSDVTWDLSAAGGTFWGAVGATQPGITALKAIEAIKLKADALTGITGDVFIARVSKQPVPTGVNEYTVAGIFNHVPDLFFDVVSAPTTATLILEWDLKDGEAPVKCLATA